MRPFLLLVAFLALSLAVPLRASNISVRTYPLQSQGLKLFLQEQVLASQPKNAPNILLVHGLVTGSSDFDPRYQDYSLAKALARGGCRVWLLDIAGYGRSQKPASGWTVTNEYAARDVAAAMRAIQKITGANQVDLLGWSWGTIVAARAAALEPKLVGKIVFYAPVYFGFNVPAPTTDWFTNTWPFTARHISDPNKVDPLLADVILSNTWHYSPVAPNGARREFFRPGGNKVATFDPKPLTMPVLFLEGTQDTYLNFPQLDALFAQLPNPGKRRIMVDGANHHMMWERAYYRRFQQDILNFVKN